MNEKLAHVTHAACVKCKERFSDLNCRTEAGWQETQISGLCESCFDEITAEPEDEEPPDPDGECFRGGEYASALAEEQAWIQRNLK